MSEDSDTLDSMLRGVAATPSVRPPPRIGETLGGRYVIEAVIGQGGMGTVFRALDEKLGETVALKVMTGALDEQVLRDEVRLAQKVTHPNVCRTFDLEDVDGYHLVKMELVPGETLAARLAREPKLAIDDCIRVARAIASGLGAAHQRKIVHGDLKPGNVMLDGDRVVLMDFGIARLAADPVDGVRGTVGYMAPELVRDGKADERADIYALGCVLYEMLAGEPVFSGASAVVIAARHASERAPDVRAKRPQTPRWLASAVALMLAKRPDDRPAGLARLVAGPRPRTRWILSGTLLVTGLVLGVWQLTRPSPWIPQVRDFPRFRENCDDMSFSPDGRWIAFSSDRRDGNVARAYLTSVAEDEEIEIARDHEGDYARFSRDGKALLFSATPPQAALGPSWYRQPIAGPPWHESGPLEEGGRGAVFDDCGDALLIIDDLSTNMRVSLRFPNGNTRVVYETRPGERLTDARCDPTGQRIVIVEGAGNSGHNDVYLADRSRNWKQLTHDHVTGSAVFAADGHTLVVSRVARDQHDRLQLFEEDLDGNVIRQLLVDEGPDRVSDVSRDGRYLAFSRDDVAKNPVLVSSHGVTYITRVRSTFWYPREVTSHLVVAQRNTWGRYDVVAISVDTGEMSVLTRGTSPFPSLDGRTIYFASEDDPTLLYAIPATGGAARRIAKLPAHIQFGNAGPDGLHVAVNMSDNKVTGYRVSEAGSVEREAANGLVSTAAPGGWRAVTVYADKLEYGGTDLYLVAPGASLDSRDWHISAMSIHNRWLDDHRISYCLRDHCEILDVTRPTAPAALKQPNPTDAEMATVTLDETQVLTSVYDSRTTRHVITNFDQR